MKKISYINQEGNQYNNSSGTQNNYNVNGNMYGGSIIIGGNQMKNVKMNDLYELEKGVDLRTIVKYRNISVIIAVLEWFIEYFLTQILDVTLSTGNRYYMAFVIISSIFAISMVHFVTELEEKKICRGYIERNGRVYRIIPKKCPLCGNTANGQLRYKKEEDGTETMTCDKKPRAHRWEFDYTQIEIEGIDSEE